MCVCVCVCVCVGSNAMNSLVTLSENILPV